LGQDRSRVSYIIIKHLGSAFQMSAYASLFAFERDYGVRVFMGEDQLSMIEPYFNSSKIRARMRTLEEYLPDWSSYTWFELFR
jgi:hypothetical protein